MNIETPPVAAEHPVMRAGHVQLRVHDLDESLHFYTQVLGLVETGRDAEQRLYLKGWDERDHASLVLRRAKEPGLDLLGFKLRSEAALQRLHDALRAADVDCRRIAAGELLHTGERLRFDIASGHTIELYAQKVELGNGLPFDDPPAWHDAGERGAGVSRFDHAVLYGPGLQQVHKLFGEVLGFHLSERILEADARDNFALWLSTSSKPADVVFVRHPTRGRLHRLAFRVESAEQVLRAADVFSMNRTQIDVGPLRDPVARRVSVQAFDPSGNRVEVFCGGYDSHPDATPLTWSWKRAGAPMALRDQRARERLFPELT